MIDQLIQWDKQFFTAINSGIQSGLLDMVCPFMRKQSNWYLLYAVIAFFLFRKYQVRALWILLSAGLLILISDQVSANLIKNMVQRIRPCNDPDFKDQVRLLVGCGGGYSYLSAHATNHFAIAIFMYQVWGKVYKWFLPVALFWAASIAFSQVYVGVHYPLDVVSGALLGTILGYVGGSLVNRFILQSQIKS
jgi:undecaprenyl-diphosphatase